VRDETFFKMLAVFAERRRRARRALAFGCFPIIGLTLLAIVLAATARH
jgi:hypothetical protein